MIIRPSAGRSIEAHTVLVNCTFHPRDQLRSLPKRLGRVWYAKCQQAIRWVAPFCRCGGFVASPLGRHQHATRKKRGPGKIRGRKSGRKLEGTAREPRSPSFLALEAEAGEVAVAQRNARGSHQRAIDRGEQTGDEGGVGCEADRSSLGHGSSLSWKRPGGRLVIWEQSMYTRCQKQRICLHGSILDTAMQYLGQ